MERLTIVKVGGAVVEDAEQLSQLIESFSRIEGKKVLVHGGGRRATAVAASLGIKTTMIGGRRVTDKDMLEVVTMVYGGLVNKGIIAALEAKGQTALGLTGADMDIIRSHKRAPKKVRLDTGEEQTVDFGFVGDVDRADGSRLSQLLEAGITPVIAPLTHDGCGTILNTNADTMASTVAAALADKYSVTLIYTFEHRGVLLNPEDEESVIPLITRRDFEAYTADGTISGGMLPKVENALRAAEKGLERVVICKASEIDKERGTVIKG